MPSLVKTLQNKASRSRLRQSQLPPSNKSASTSANEFDDMPHPRARSSGNNHPYGSGSAASASTSSLLFWRNNNNKGGNGKGGRADSPAISLSGLPPSPTPSPKPILLRAPSPGPNAISNVRFPEVAQKRRASTIGAMRPTRPPSAEPPTAYRQSYHHLIESSPPEQPRSESRAESVRSTASVNTIRRVPVPQYLAASPKRRESPTPSTMAVGQRAGYNPLSPTGRTSVVDDRRRSMYRSSPPSSPYKGARAHAREVREQRRSSTIPDQEFPAPPQHLPPQRPPKANAAVQQHQPQSYPSNAPRQATQRPRRPSSTLVSDGRPRRSSRPSLPSSSRTRDSITSLASLSMSVCSLSASSASNHSVSIAGSSRPQSPVSPISQVQPLSAAALMPAPQLARPMLETVPQSPDVEQLSTMPQSPEVARLTTEWLQANRPSTPVTPTQLYLTSSGNSSPCASPSLASTPGGACPTSPAILVTPQPHRASSIVRRRTVSYAGDGSPLPMFKVIPATPSHHRKPSMLTGNCDDDETLDEKSPARILDFGEPNWRATSSRQPSPCGGKVSPLSASPFDNGSDDDDGATPTATTSTTPATTPTSFPRSLSTESSSPDSSPKLSLESSPKLPPKSALRSTSPSPPSKAPPTPPRNPARVLSMMGPPPPKPAKNPKRATTLYSAHDDGRSISQSLAELAALACDLPPFGAEMTAAANQAAARLAAARAATETPGRDRRPPPCAPPRAPPPPIPTNVAPFSGKAGRGPTTPPPTAQRQAPYTARPMSPFNPLPPSPPFSTHRSLPSLGSYESVPSEVSSLGDLVGLQCASTASLASTVSDTEEAMITMVRTLSPRSDSLTPSLDDSLISTPKACAADQGGLGLGINVDFSNSSSRIPSPSPLAPSCMSTFDGEFPLPPSPPLRIHRMSAAAANPNRAAFYGSTNFLMRSAANSSTNLNSTENCAKASTHGPQHSISSLASMGSSGENCSDIDEDEVLTASIVAFQPYAPAKYIVTQDPRTTTEVGVAF